MKGSIAIDAAFEAATLPARAHPSDECMRRAHQHRSAFSSERSKHAVSTRWPARTLEAGDGAGDPGLAEEGEEAKHREPAVVDLGLRKIRMRYMYVSSSIRGQQMCARTRSDLAFLSGLILDVKPNGSHSFLMGTCAGHRRRNTRT